MSVSAHTAPADTRAERGRAPSKHGHPSKLTTPGGKQAHVPHPGLRTHRARARRRGRHAGRATGTRARSVGPPAHAPRPAPLPPASRPPNPSRDGRGALCRPLPRPTEPGRAEGKAGGVTGLRGRGRGGARLETGGEGQGRPHPGRSRRVLADPGGVRSPQFLGRWFTSGLASNSSWFREKKNALSMCISVVAPSAEGGLNLTTTFLRWAGRRALRGAESSPPHGHDPGTAPGLTPDPFGDLPTGKTSVRPGPCCCGRRKPQAATATRVPVSGAPLLGTPGSSPGQPAGGGSGQPSCPSSTRSGLVAPWSGSASPRPGPIDPRLQGGGPGTLSLGHWILFGADRQAPPCPPP